MKNNNLNFINIKSINSSHYYEFSLEYQFEGEAHDYWEMVYVDKGEAVVISDKDTFTLNEGEAYFHQPNEFHSIGANGKNAANVYIISFTCVSGAMKYFKKRKIQIFPHFYYYVNNLINISKETYNMSISLDERNLEVKDSYRIIGPQLLRSFLELMLIMMIRRHTADVNKEEFSYIHIDDNKYVYQAIKLIEDNIYGKINVEEICKSLGVSRTYISKIFKEKTATTLNEYYNNLKINEAKKLISTHMYSISQVSEKLCFDNPQYFSKVFKRITGVSPKEYLSI